MPTRQLLLCPVASLTGVCHATAAVSSTGAVYPADNPFTGGYEGVAESQVFVDWDPSESQPLYETASAVVVGAAAYGAVQVTDGSALRYEHLVLGGSQDDIYSYSGVDPYNNYLYGSTTGYGLMTISGFGSVYNNHPQVVPTPYQDDRDPHAPLFPRDDNPARGVFNPHGPSRSDHAGFDAYVGLTGTGELRIVDGGRAEIQDALVVGWGPSSHGLVVIDGAGSALQAYANYSPGEMYPNDTGPLPTLVGGQGHGAVHVTGGGHLASLGGARIGSTGYESRNNGSGGSGDVLIHGDGSRWVVHDGPDCCSSSTPTLALGQTVGNDGAPYNQSLGTGRLTVAEGGLLSLLPPPRSSQMIRRRYTSAPRGRCDSWMGAPCEQATAASRATASSKSKDAATRSTPTSPPIWMSSQRASCDSSTGRRSAYGAVCRESPHYPWGRRPPRYPLRPVRVRLGPATRLVGRRRGAAHHRRRRPPRRVYFALSFERLRGGFPRGRRLHPARQLQRRV